jgi:hypothetical protein
VASLLANSDGKGMLNGMNHHQPGQPATEMAPGREVSRKLPCAGARGRLGEASLPGFDALRSPAESRVLSLYFRAGI